MKKYLSLALCLVLVLSGFALAEPAGVDVDFTGIEPDAVYDALYDMLDAPEDFRGKTTRLTGHVSYIDGDDGDPEWFYLTVGDYISCCVPRVEFVPNALPEGLDDVAFEDVEVTLTGVLDFYEEDGYTDFRIIDAELTL